MNVKYPITPDMHAAIRRTYLRGTGKGEIATCAKKLNLPRWKVSRYALHQGWVAKQKKAPKWTEGELKILKRNAHLTPERILIKLKAAGFHERTLAGIILKRKRMRYLSNLTGQSASSVAICLGEDVHFVLRAIRTGRLRAKKRGTNRTEKQGGDAWHIKDKDIRNFIIENVHSLDFRKVDKYWFTDLVAGREIE